MRFLFRVFIVLMVVFAGLSAIRRLLGSTFPARPQPRGPAPGGHLVKDPVCGMYVPQESSLRAGDQFFCSEECRGKFVKS
jgi:hypothetical protein